MPCFSEATRSSVPQSLAISLRSNSEGCWWTPSRSSSSCSISHSIACRLVVALMWSVTLSRVSVREATLPSMLVRRESASSPNSEPLLLDGPTAGVAGTLVGNDGTVHFLTSHTSCRATATSLQTSSTDSVTLLTCRSREDTRHSTASMRSKSSISSLSGPSCRRAGMSKVSSSPAKLTHLREGPGAVTASGGCSANVAPGTSERPFPNSIVVPSTP
mmetsp:Transcript_27574/g.72682  ORF Transcript_27574/g.72682 Transcript_27574/m.72682 type:complete len:217 (+) Transcript_27574:1221-1871(+)